MATSLKKRIWGWYFFDWASQPVHTLLLTFIFGPFFASVAAAYFLGLGLDEHAADAQAQSVWSMGLTIMGLIIAVSGPIMGAMADTSGRRMPWIVAFSIMYVAGSALLWWTDPSGANMWAMLFAFAIAFIGAECALIFTNAQLPSLGNSEEIGRISGSGFAFGYLGGLIALAIMLALFVEQGNGKTLIGANPAFGFDASQKEGTRFVGPFTAIWYAVFMVPYFLWVREVRTVASRISILNAMKSLKAQLASILKRRSLAAYLGSSMFYRDGLNGLYGFGGVYAKLVLNWEIVSIGVFGIISGIAAAIFSWIGGRADRRFGPKPVIVFCILVLILVVVTIVCMSREAFFGIPLPEGSKLPDMIFFGCGVVIGGAGGTLQSASRTLMVRHTDESTATEAFGIYGLSGRATAFLAPALIGMVTTMTQSARIGVSPLIGLFLLGLILLAWVNPKGDAGTWSEHSS